MVNGTLFMPTGLWSKAGVLDRIFEKLQVEQIVGVKLEAVSLKSTSIKVHPDGSRVGEAGHLTYIPTSAERIPIGDLAHRRTGEATAGRARSLDPKGKRDFVILVLLSAALCAGRKSPP